MNKKACTKSSFPAVVRRIISSWLIVAVCAALGLCVSAFVLVPSRNEKAAAAEMNASLSLDEKLGQWKSELTSEDITYADNALNFKRTIQNAGDYADNAVLAVVNAYAVPTETVYYRVTTDESVLSSYTVCKEYSDCVANGTMLRLLCVEMGWDESTGYYTDILSAGIADSYNFYLTVICPSAESADTVAAALSSAVDAERLTLESSYGTSIQVTESASSCITKYSATAVDRQWSAKYYINLDESQYNSMLSEMIDNPAQNNYFWAMAGLQDGCDYSDKYLTTDDMAVSAPRSAKFYYAVGILGGIVLGLAVIILQILFGNTLLAAEELTTVFGLPLAAVVSSRGKKFAGSAEAAAARLTVICRASGISSVILGGSNLGNGKTVGKKKNAAAAALEIASRLDAAGIKASVMGSWETASAEDLTACGNVILVEECSVSSYQGIESEVITIRGCRLNLVAAVAVE